MKMPPFRDRGVLCFRWSHISDRLLSLYGGTSEFRGNPNFDAKFSSGFSLCKEILNIIFKTVNGHLIVHEHGIDTIFLIGCI